MLVLATPWRESWDKHTARPSEDADPHAQAREWLDGRDIRCPTRSLWAVARAGHPRRAARMDLVRGMRPHVLAMGLASKAGLNKPGRRQPTAM